MKKIGGAVWKRHLLHRIALLCRHGGGLQAVAGSFCAAVTELIGADAGMIVWFDADHAPQGFYHQTAPAEVKDLFILQLDTQFLATEEVSAESLVIAPGPRVGRMLAPGMLESFERTNIYRQLCVPIGHHYLLDMSAVASGVGSAVYFACNPPNAPFSQRHADLLHEVQPLMQIALSADAHGTSWLPVSQGVPHLIANQSGDTLLAIGAEAERILTSSQLLRQNLAINGQMREAPGFVRILAAQLTAANRAEMSLPVANGRLLCRAERTRFLNEAQSESWQLFVGLELMVAENAGWIDFISKRNLTPLQREIMLHGMQGLPRASCSARFGVSEAALKKHLKVILAEAAVSSWEELQRLSPQAWQQAIR